MALETPPLPSWQKNFHFDYWNPFLTWLSRNSSKKKECKYQDTVQYFRHHSEWRDFTLKISQYETFIEQTFFYFFPILFQFLFKLTFADNLFEKLSSLLSKPGPSDWKEISQSYSSDLGKISHLYYKSRLKHFGKLFLSLLQPWYNLHIQQES